MDLKTISQPNELERYSFLWSEVRLVVAAVSLFIGGVPVAYRIFGYGLFTVVHAFLVLFWIVSGAASVYLFYRWMMGDKKLFGKKELLDTVAFFVSIISGINLGLVGLMGTNIGMSILAGKIIFIATGILYLWAAFYLFSHWSASGQRVFK